MTLGAAAFVWLIPLLLGLLWWLQRRAAANQITVVSSLKLWPTQTASRSGGQRSRLDRRWLLRALLLTLLALCLAAPGWRHSGNSAAPQPGPELQSLVLKRDYDSGRYSAMFSVTNRSAEQAVVEIQLRADSELIVSETLTLAGGTTTSRQLPLDQAPRNSLQLSLAQGNGGTPQRLALAAAQLLPAPVALASACGPHLQQAVTAHPALRIAAAGDAAVMAIDCNSDLVTTTASIPTLFLPASSALQPVTAIPWWTLAAASEESVYLDLAWLRYAPATPIGASDTVLLMAGTTPLIVSRGNSIVSAVNLAAPTLVTQPALPLLLNALLDRLTDANLQYGTVTVSARPVPATAELVQPLTAYLLILCILLVCGELLLRRHR